MLLVLLLAILLHFIADVLLQNAWMAEHKTDWKHLAAWTHAGIHFACQCIVLHPLAALIVALTHLWIDTGTPLEWWNRVYLHATRDKASLCILQDQILHIAVLAAAVCMTS